MKRLLSSLAGVALLCGSLVPGQVLAEGYRLNAGDTLRVEVLEDPTLNRAVLVAPDGRISVPLAGAVTAKGRTIEAVQADLVSKLSPNFGTAPNVFVSLERRNEARGSSGAASTPTIDIFVIGEVAKPGKLQVSPGTNLLQALAQMGGFGKFAAVKRLQLRQGAQTVTFSYKDIEAGSSNIGATVLSAGDVILVPQRKLFE